MMGGCPKCKTASGVLFLLLGLAFLLADWGVWGFWNISWYSALFVLMGVVSLAKCKCKDCMAMCMPMGSSKGRKR